MEAGKGRKPGGRKPRHGLLQPPLFTLPERDREVSPDQDWKEDTAEGPPEVHEARQVVQRTPTSIGCQEKEGSGVCGQNHHKLLYGSQSAYARPCGK